MNSVFPDSARASAELSVDAATSQPGWRAAALAALCEADPLAKSGAVTALYALAQDGA
ncbi:DUF455 domain-containing protein, partial [Paraburkholderia sp. Ac-20347]|nr:DUF455 domain-containing protein [Paraburkholderia sp. Ac-20347]